MAQISIEERFESAPSFRRIVELVGAENPLQRKRIRSMLDTRDASYWAFAESMSTSLEASFMREAGEARAAAAAYDELCFEMLREQIRFRKTGAYRLAAAADANDTVYSNPARMRRYLTGLMLTYLFWPNHYELLRLFQRGLDRLAPRVALEVGAGHGLFTAGLLRRHPGVDLTLVDISESSMEMTQAFLGTLGVATSSVSFRLVDFMAPDLGLQPFDLIVMGEVIEHVDDAPALLNRARDLLAEDGHLFLTTCANCPAADHIYYFGSASEIRTLIRDCGLMVSDEIILPAEDVPEASWEADKITINYGAFLRRATASSSSGRRHS